jgi:hypothetical protein
VGLFAITLPATRLATGSAADPQLAPLFITAGRAALAGLLSLAFLLVTRSPWPARRHWGPLLGAVSGNVIGYPLLLALALRSVTATHAGHRAAAAGDGGGGGADSGAARAAGLLGLRRGRQRAGGGVCLAARRPGRRLWPGAGRLAAAGRRGGRLGGLCVRRPGHARAGRRARDLLDVRADPAFQPAGHALPVARHGGAAVRASAWLGFAYVGSVSMWAGFFAWFRGLDWGGALRVSQVQLLQPFLSMLFALPLLGERLDAGSIGFALAVVATVVLGRRISRPAAPASVAQGDPT